MTYIYLSIGALIGMVIMALCAVAGDRRRYQDGYQKGYSDGHTDGFQDGVKSIGEVG